MQKYDKSLEEVWEWRRKVHEKLKGLTPEEYVRKVREESDAILAKYGIKLRKIKSRRDLQKTK